MTWSILFVAFLFSGDPVEVVQWVSQQSIICFLIDSSAKFEFAQVGNELIRAECRVLVSIDKGTDE